jgi:spore coat polysaccharide biosynthesis predicted glycosyltransferase SpsG
MSAPMIDAKRVRVLLRVDADPAIGFGHAVRCSALLAALRSDLDVVVAGDAVAALAAVFPAARVRSVEKDGLEVILRSERADVVVVDLPRHAPDLWNELRRLARLVVAVDDEGGAIDADIVVNGAAPESCHRYPALRGGAVALTGPAYALLRPEFRSARWRDPESASVAIVVGSGARARDWALALAGDALDRSAWGEVAMAVGRAFPDLDELRNACRRAGIRLVSGLDARAMAEHLAAAQVALITGGMIMSETLAVGAPAVVFPQVDNMVPEARWFAERGAIRDLGCNGGMAMRRVAVEVDGLLSDRIKACELSAQARRLVDGRGAERAAGALAARLADVARVTER